MCVSRTMLNRFKNALFTAVGGLDGTQANKEDDNSNDNRLMQKFPYTRPDFLQFATEEEMLVSADHSIRPIIVPRDVTKLPWKSGYAETINAGKSVRNEDQAVVHVGLLRRMCNEQNDVISNDTEDPCQSLPYVYFAVFDGHAGAGASVAASNTLHHIIQERLTSVIDLLLPSCSVDSNKQQQNRTHNNWFPEKEISPESLIVGALESAFWDMDLLIEQDRLKYRMIGGCTALVALFILGKLYVSNAGDSRAVICRGEKAIPMSHDFTPETERQRIRNLALQKPELLGGEYTALEFCRHPIRKDIGKKLLYRETYMTGWVYKTITPEDLRFPLVYGDGKRSRVLATIGVTRGFGDHDLKAQNSNLNIKPFLTPQPEVCIYNIENEELSADDVLVLGTDGLWDITTNEKAAEIVQKTLDHFCSSDDSRYRYRYASTAQDLVMHSRGKLRERNWRTVNGTPATIDDITVFVIPLLPYKEDYNHWLEARRFITEINRESGSGSVSVAEEAQESQGRS